MFDCRFRSSFYFEEKLEDIKIYRNDFRRIGNFYLRMNYEFWRVLRLLFIIVRGKFYLFFYMVVFAVGILLLNGVYRVEEENFFFRGSFLLINYKVVCV